MQRQPERELKKRGRFFKWTAIATLWFLALFVTSIAATPVWAQTGLETAQDISVNVAEAAGVNAQTDLVTIIGRIINIALGFVGVILLVILIYAGYEYMTAGGDGEKVKKAVTRIRNAIIGLIIIAASFAITNWILSMLAGAVTGTGLFGGGATTQGGFGQWGNSGCLGQSGIVYHYPEPGQKDVPRNTAIAITFSEAVDKASFINGWSESTPTVTDLNADMVKIHPLNNPKDNLAPNKARVMVSANGKIVVIKPNEPLGNAQQPVYYEIALDGGIKNASGTAMCGDFKSGYSWSFQVSTKIDNTPPQVLNYFPTPGIWARNVVTQINFSEPMLPISVSGFYKEGAPSNFQNLLAQSDDGKTVKIVDGEWRVSNGYRTAEFATTDECGTNSCLMKMYCFPASTTMAMTVRAAQVTDNPPQAAEAGPFGFDGAVDMAGNSLDGDRNSTAVGPDQDNVKFGFKTSEEIRISSPVIGATDPEVNPGKVRGEVALDKNVDVTWQKDSLLLMSSLDNASVQMRAKGPKESDPNTWSWYTKAIQLNAKDEEASFGEELSRTKMTIYHRPFLPSDMPKNNDVWGSLNIYAPVLRHKIMDVYQNCFNPASSDLQNTGSVKEGTPNLCNEAQKSVDCWKSDAWLPKPE